MEDFRGITVGNDFIILKTRRDQTESSYESVSIYQAKESSFTTLESDTAQSKFLKAYRQAKGSCFVTLGSKHFLQIGGSGPIKHLGSRQKQTALKNVNLFSYENRQLFQQGKSRARDRINQGSFSQVRFYHYPNQEF